MKPKINNTYYKIVMSILNNIDPYIKSKGRPNKYKYDFYLKHICNMLTTGLSWVKLGEIININLDLVRKKYNKWVSLGVFEKAYKIMLNQYKRKHKSNNFFIDSTNIHNFSGKLDFGYNNKIKNKKSIKISVIIDQNGAPHYINIYKGSIHDAKIMETQINDNLKNNKKPINLIGDKCYIKGDDYRNKIYNENKIKLITPKKRNMKHNKQDINSIDELLLKDRYKVEHFFGKLKKCFKRLIIINDKTLKNYYGFTHIAASFILLSLSL